MRDELQMGLDLHNSIKAKVRGGGVPTEEEMLSYSGFQQELQLLSHSKGTPGVNPYLDFYQDLQADMQRATGETENLVPPVHGLSRTEINEETGDRTPYDVKQISGPMLAGAGFYPFPTDLGDQPLEINEGLVRRANQLSGGEVRLEMVGNQPTYVLDDGHETWDMTEQMGLWNRPDVKALLRESLAGRNPSTALNEMASLTAAAGFVDKALYKAGLGDRPLRQGMPTATPGVKLPWEVPLGENGSYRGDEDAIYQDPLYSRALSETITRMQESGELVPGFWESLRGGLAFVADFALFSKGLGAIGGGVKALRGAAAAEGLAPMGMRAYAQASGLSTSRMFAFPLNTHFAQTAALLAAHGTFSNLGNPETKWTDDVWHGVTTAAELALAGGVAKVGRGALTRFVPGLGRAAAKIAPRMALGFDPTGLMAHTKDTASKMLSALRTLPSADGKFTTTFKQLALGGIQRETVLRSLDSMVVGMHLGAKGWAAAQPGYEKLSLSDRVGLYWRGLGSPAALGTGASFMLAGLALSIPAQRKAIGDFLASDAGKDLMHRYIKDLGLPEKAEDARASFEAIDNYAKAEPELFRDVVKMTPEERGRSEREAAFIYGVRGPEPWDPLGGPPPHMETSAKIEPLTPGVTDALSKFKAIIDEGRGIIERAAPEIQHPVYHVGEITKERLSELGFKDHKHAMNAVQEYLRVVEGNTETRYDKLKDVPRALFERSLEWRDRQKMLPLEERGGVTLLEQLGRDLQRAEKTPRQLELEAGAEEFRLPPVRREQRQLGLGEQGMSVNDVAQAVERAEGNPVYAGKSPIEIATEMKAKRVARRPTLGRALELVREGKKTREWLRSTFPEGAAVAVEGPVESWWGGFERAVRDTWNRNAASRLAQHRLRKQEFTLRDFIRGRGGIRYETDWENLTLKEEGEGKRKPVVHRKGSGKGMAPDEATELAWEAGFFPERPTINELMDALHDNMRHPSSGERDLPMRMAHERRTEAMHADQLIQWREEIESGRAELPDAPEARRQQLFDVFAGDARFQGMSPERVEREVLALRAEAELGAPAPEDAAPPETAADVFEFTAAKTRRFTETLQWAGLLPLDVGPRDPIVSQALVDVSANKESLRGPGVARFGEGGWARVVEGARMIRTAHREVMVRAMAEEGRKPGELTEVEDTFTFIDAELAGRDVPAEVRARLKGSGALDENGLLHTRWEMLLVEESARAAFDAQQRAREQAQGIQSGFGSFLPPTAFSGRTWTHVEETSWGKALTMSNWVSKPGAQRFLSRNRYARGLANAAKSTVGPLSGPILEREKSMMERLLLKLGQRRSEAGWPQIQMSFALSRLWKAWQGARPPEAHLEFMDRLFDTGAVRSLSGPEDLERMHPGTGYLWQTITEARDILQEFGTDWVRLGLMTQGQLDTLGNGGYVQHTYVREQLAREAQQMGRGELPLKYFMFLLPRQGGSPDGAFIRVNDATINMRLSVHAQSTLRRAVHTLYDVIEDPTFWKNLGDFGRMNEYERSRYQLAATRTTMEEAALAKNQPGFNQEAARLGITLVKLEERMAKKGEEPGPDQIAYSERLDQVIKHYLGEGPAGTVFLPKPVAQELDLALSDVYAMSAEAVGGGPLGRGSVFGQGALHYIDTVGAWWKRGRTSLRFSYWTQQVLSNAQNNWGSHRLPLSDFTAGVAGLPSFTRDGMQHFARLSRWMSEGMPKVRPESWSEKDWNEAQAAKAYHDLAGGSSYALTGLSTDMAESFGLALDNHNSVREMLGRQAAAKAAAEGWSESQIEGVNRSILELSGRLQGSLDPIDEAIGRMISSPDPVAHARAFGAANAMNFFMDLALFKYPAYLKAKHEWPDASPARLIAYSTAGAGDLRNTAAPLRRWISMHSPIGSEIQRSTTPHVAAKSLGAFFFRNAFWMWRNATIPTLLRASLRHPVTGLAAAALGGVGVKALMGAVQRGDPDDTEKFEEEMRHARRGALHQYLTPNPEKAAIQRILSGFKLRGAPEKSPSLADFWKRVVNGFVAEAPSRMGETQYFDLRDMAGPFGQAAKTGGAVVDLYNTITAPMGSDKLREIASAADRLMGMNGQIAADVLFGGPGDLVDAMQGTTSWGEFWIKAMRDIGRQMPEIYPVVGLVSPTGQRIGENVFAGGQPFNELYAGIERTTRADARGLPLARESAADLMADSLTSIFWPSRMALQKRGLSAPTDTWTTLASAVLGESVDPATERGKQSRAAAHFVGRELGQVFGDIYQQHVKERAEPATAQIALDDRIVGALNETMMHTVETAPDVWELEPGYAPEGAVLRAIANGSAVERSYRIKYLRRYVTQSSFKEVALNALFDIGRREEMGVGLFGEAIRRSMIDPSGTNLLGWWWSQIRGGDKVAMEQLAPLINDTPRPAKGSEAFGYWRDIWGAYADAGLEFPLTMSDEDRAEIEKRAGTHLMLQGGTPLRQAARSRKLFEPLIPR